MKHYKRSKEEILTEQVPLLSLLPKITKHQHKKRKTQPLTWKDVVL